MIQHGLAILRELWSWLEAMLLAGFWLVLPVLVGGLVVTCVMVGRGPTPLNISIFWVFVAVLGRCCYCYWRHLEEDRPYMPIFIEQHGLERVVRHCMRPIGMKMLLGLQEGSVSEDHVLQVVGQVASVGERTVNYRLQMAFGEQSATSDEQVDVPAVFQRAFPGDDPAP